MSRQITWTSAPRRSSRRPSSGMRGRSSSSPTTAILWTGLPPKFGRSARANLGSTRAITPTTAGGGRKRRGPSLRSLSPSALRVAGRGRPEARALPEPGREEREAALLDRAAALEEELARLEQEMVEASYAQDLQRINELHASYKERCRELEEVLKEWELLTRA
jgi:hypothetical protein